MKVRCHYCQKSFQHYGTERKYVWCTAKCMEKDKKKKKALLSAAPHKSTHHDKTY